MARIAKIEKKADLSPEHQAVFDAIAQSRGRVQGPFAMLLHSPELAGRVAHLGALVRFEMELPRKLKELVILTVARELDCRFEWSVHAGHARAAGVPDDCIEALRERSDPQGLTPEEADVCRYAQELLRSHRVSGPTFAAVEKALGAAGCVELSALIGYYVLLACVLNSMEVEPAEGGEPLNGYRDPCSARKTE